MNGKLWIFSGCVSFALASGFTALGQVVSAGEQLYFSFLFSVPILMIVLKWNNLTLLPTEKQKQKIPVLIINGFVCFLASMTLLISSDFVSLPRSLPFFYSVPLYLLFWALVPPSFQLINFSCLSTILSIMAVGGLFLLSEVYDPAEEEGVTGF
jgi:hypothetical protein